MNDPIVFKTLHCTLDGAVATISLDRPEVLHAINGTMFDELESLFISLAADSAIRVVLLTGIGERAFAAGADIRALGRNRRRHRPRRLPARTSGLRAHPIPPRTQRQAQSLRPSMAWLWAAAVSSHSPARSASPATRPASAFPRSSSASSLATAERSASRVLLAAAPLCG